jgi:hypothetical protein
MSKLGIGTGITPDDGNGDSLLVGAVKVNSNFNEIYSYFGDGTNLTSGSWQKVTSGINTTSNVGIGTTNPRFKLEVGAVGASGTTLYVNGDARITGIVTIGTSSITLNGSTNRITVGSGVTIDGSTGIISATSVVLGGTTITGAGVKVTGITSTQDLIVYGNGNESGSISTVALMSRNNYIDFGPAIENTSAVQQFALRLGSDRAPGTFGVYNILGASWTNPSGSVFLNNWNGTAAIGISDTAVSVTARPLTVGTGTSTGTVSQTLQVTGGAYVSGSVGIGTTNPSSKLTVVGDFVSGDPNDNNSQFKVDSVGNASISPGRLLYLNGPTNTNVGLKWTNAIGIELYNLSNLGGSDRNITLTSGNDGSVVLSSVGTGNNSLRVTSSGVDVTSGISTFSGNVKVGVSTAAGVILTSSNGTKYQLFVENDGTLKTVAV